MDEPRDWREMDRWGEDEDRPTPEQVRAQLTGTGGAPSEELDIEGLLQEGINDLANRQLNQAIWEAVDGVTFLDIEHEDTIYRGERCPTCGRMSDCCCEDCETCVAGIPRLSERRSTR